MGKKKNLFMPDAFNTLQNIKSNSDLVEAKDNFRFEYIDIDEINLNPENFYSSNDSDEDINELAENIEEIGLQHNIVVNDKSRYEDNKYMLISGERRLKAIKKLVNAGKEKFRKVPTQIQNVNDQDVELMLIEANAKTRETSPSIKIKETERLREIYSHKKANNSVDVGGERKHIAESMGVKETQAGRLIAITNKLIPELKDLIDELGIGSASEIAKMSEEHQKIFLDNLKTGIFKAEDVSKTKAEEIKKQSNQIAKELKIQSEEKINELKLEYEKELEVQNDKLKEFQQDVEMIEKIKNENIELNNKFENEKKNIIVEAKLEEEKKLSENNALLLKTQEDLKKEKKKLEKEKKKNEKLLKELELAKKNSNSSTNFNEGALRRKINILNAVNNAVDEILSIDKLISSSDLEDEDLKSQLTTLKYTMNQLKNKLGD
nr:ParB N-terminal domain-containing protein [Clostridioides sp.]